MRELVNADLLAWDAHAGSPMATGNLTLAGWERYEAMIHRSHDGGYGFFAWEFGSEETKALFKDVLKPAFAETGYPLKDMQDLAQPGLIDNIMQDRIRNASFVIVDLTDGNHGAYWVRIPRHADHPFRRMPTTDSEACRPPVPTEVDHRFRAMSSTVRACGRASGEVAGRPGQASGTG